MSSIPSKRVDRSGVAADSVESVRCGADSTNTSGGDFVRTDNASGEQRLVGWGQVIIAVSADYSRPEELLWLSVMGLEVRCFEATYQHRDFVPGFERSVGCTQLTVYRYTDAGTDAGAGGPISE